MKKTSLIIIATIAHLTLLTVTQAQTVLANQLDVKGVAAITSSWNTTPLGGNDASLNGVLYVGHVNGADPNTAYATFSSGIINGTSNDIAAFYSLITGNSNTLGGRYSAIFGSSNELNSGLIFDLYSQNSFVTGYNNTVYGANNTFVAGQNNLVDRDDNHAVYAPETDAVFFSTALGVNNTLSSAYGYLLGIANVVRADGGVAVGGLLNVDTYGTTAVGFANETILGDRGAHQPEDPVFIVGNGTDDTNRSNALVILKSGDVIIPKAQGDISMGIFAPAP